MLSSIREMKLYVNRPVSTNSRMWSTESSVPSTSFLKSISSSIGFTMKLGTKGMDFKNYASCILILEEAKEGSKRFAKKQKQTCFQNKKGNMVMMTIDKCKFGQLNDKRYILPDGMSSLPYGYRDIKFIKNFKDSISLTPEKLTKHHKNNLLRFKYSILETNKRMRIINCVLLQQPVFYKRGTLERSQFQIEKNTRDFLKHGL